MADSSTLRPRLGVDRRPFAAGGFGLPAPDLLGDMRRCGRQHQQQQPDRFVPLAIAGDLGPAIAIQRVRQLHQLRHHRVEAEALVVLGDVAQGPVGRRADRGGRIRRALAGRESARHPRGSPASRPFGSSVTVQTRFRNRYTPPIPLGLHGPPWSHGPMNIRNRRIVSAPYWRTRSSGSSTLPRDFDMRSPSAPRIWPWLNSRLNGSSSEISPHVAHRLRPEAAVQQMHHGVLGTAGVLIDGRPGIGQRAVDRAVLLVGRQISIPVPGRVDERVHRVRLAPGRFPADRAGDVQEGLVVVQRVVASTAIVDVLRQADRQVLERAPGRCRRARSR